MPILYIRDKTTSKFIPINAIQGLSAYQVAVKDGFIGTEAEWLASLKGDPGSIENLTKTNVESVLTGDITSHNHDTLYLGKTAKASSATTSDSCTGNASTATKLATARTISISGGVTGTATSFDGSANISIPVTSVDATKLSGTAAVNTSGSSGSCTGNSATATKLQTTRTISLTGAVTGSTTFDGSANATITTTNSREGVNNVTTLVSLPVDKDVIYATLSAATDISLASALSLGQSITIVCLPSAGFTQPIPTSNGFTSMDGDSLTFVSGKLAEISILCYATNNYSISSKIAS